VPAGGARTLRAAGAPDAGAPLPPAAPLPEPEPLAPLPLDGGPLKGVPGRISLSPEGQVVFRPAGGEERRLTLVRGLRNAEGEHNCFLNVLLQGLWALRPVRQALLGSGPGAASAGRGAAPADAAVLQALRAVFLDLATVPPPPTAEARLSPSLFRARCRRLAHLARAFLLLPAAPVLSPHF